MDCNKSLSAYCSAIKLQQVAEEWHWMTTQLDFSDFNLLSLTYCAGSLVSNAPRKNVNQNSHTLTKIHISASPFGTSRSPHKVPMTAKVLFLPGFHTCFRNVSWRNVSWLNIHRYIVSDQCCLPSVGTQLIQIWFRWKTVCLCVYVPQRGKENDEMGGRETGQRGRDREDEMRGEKREKEDYHRELLRAHIPPSPAWTSLASLRHYQHQTIPHRTHTHTHTHTHIHTVANQRGCYNIVCHSSTVSKLWSSVWAVCCKSSH